MDPTATSPPSTAKHAGLPGSAGTLNVILHGLLTIAKASEEITVYVPNMGSDHVYRAGNWLTETTMDQGEFTLRGVTKNKPSEHPFSLEHNLVLQNTHIADANCCNRVYATLHFPYPESTVSLSRLPVPDAGIGGGFKVVDLP